MLTKVTDSLKPEFTWVELGSYLVDLPDLTEAVDFLLNVPEKFQNTRAHAYLSGLMAMRVLTALHNGRDLNLPPVKQGQLLKIFTDHQRDLGN